MHPYSVDSSEHRVVPFFLAALGILAALALSEALAWLNWTVPWWFDAPAAMGCYSLIYVTFDQYLWRIPVLHSLGVIKTPWLAGRWSVEIESSFGERGDKHSADAEIRQTWARIVIALETPYSRSHSTVAGIVPDAPSGPLVTYEYLNEPKSSAESGMHMHRGVARLRLTGDGRVLEGEYYSGRDRQNHGSLRLERR